MEPNYKITKYTCYLFYILQGTLLNIAAVLFVPLQEQFGLSYMQLGALISINFATQLTVDIVLSKMVDKKGPDHKPTFTVEVLIDEKVEGKGYGTSLKSAEKEAARCAYERIIGKI